jgi:hypothetical protein
MPVVIGRKVNVLHVVQLPTGPFVNDLCCGDTTVVSINPRTGSFKLANGYQFHADGSGFAKNNACRVGPAQHVWNDVTLPYETRNAAYIAYRKECGDANPEPLKV